ncbi:sugar MFS transporter [Shewanella sp.]|uniref:sugar MFS transporter n=1 Tax=Shewanella sp. TaxID=50422 RepID=UPI000C116B32|nr:sugar MFS transporter [Shewanella sp.]MCJ8302481.1 sugar MFS transporter [Shewanella sp.]PHQ75397.1 MAG: MFS transporter [Shewanella sp.]
MAGGTPMTSSGSQSQDSKSRVGSVFVASQYKGAMVLLVVLYFIIGFTTVLNDILIPVMREIHQLSTMEAMFVQSAFFIAFAIWAIPAGLVMEKIGYKRSLVLALGIMGIGYLLFIPAAHYMEYMAVLFALFVLATGVAFLQVALNPLIVKVGPEQTGSARMNLGGSFNSFATTIGPLIGGAVILSSVQEIDFASHGEYIIAKAAAVQIPYMVQAVAIIGIAALIYFTRLPKIDSVSTSSAGSQVKGSFLDHKHLMYGAGGIFCYVGVEVSIGSILMLYLATPEMGGLGHEQAVPLLAYYWGSTMVGRLIGFVVCQKIRTQYLLQIVTVAALALILGSFMPFALENTVAIPVLFSDMAAIEVPLAALFLILCGLCHSVMWPSIFPLSIANLGAFTPKASGLLCTMIVGGGILPPLQGFLADSIGYKWSFILCALCYVYILFFAFVGYKAGKSNKTSETSTDEISVANT